MTEYTIKISDYIVIQKHNYKKLHKLNKADSSVTLGRDNINLSGVVGCPYFSVFRMIGGGKKGKDYHLELANDAVELRDEIDIKISGSDNRNIVDDGRSQNLTALEIAELANDATNAADIVETLISNSNTFHNKTEFSQEKYLKKKEKKYFEYIQVLKPNLRMISEIMYRLDPVKIQNIRIDTLSQIITYSNIQSEGLHLLYDSGSNGLLSAALLSAIGDKTSGQLIHMHPGNMSQKQALLAMNFSEEQSNRCISVNVYSALRQHYQGNDTHDEKVVIDEEKQETSLKRKAETDDGEVECKIPKLEDGQDITNGSEHATNDTIPIGNGDTNSESKQPEPKKPKWHFDNITASELLIQKVDSLVIACKEDPQNIFTELLPFVKPGRPFVIYCMVAEPLQNLYIELKSHAKVAALKLTCNWMRNYQILPDRTHPEVMMNNQSGFLLTGYVLK